MVLFAQCFLESVNAVSQSASRYEDAHIAAFASFELGMSKAQSAQNATVSICSSVCNVFLITCIDRGTTGACGARCCLPPHFFMRI